MNHREARCEESRCHGPQGQPLGAQDWCLCQVEEDVRRRSRHSVQCLSDICTCAMSQIKEIPMGCLIICPCLHSCTATLPTLWVVIKTHGDTRDWASVAMASVRSAGTSPWLRVMRFVLVFVPCSLAVRPWTTQITFQRLSFLTFNIKVFFLPF